MRFRWLLPFVLAAGIRSIPELIVKGYPVGYDTMAHYVWIINTYVPASLASNSIATEDVTRTSEDTVAALKWLNAHAGSNSCLLVEERFRGLTMLYVESGAKIAVYGGMYPVEKALEDLGAYRFHHMYLLWYSGLEISKFTPIRTVGTMTIYEYAP
jgi:hypothetical protein